MSSSAATVAESVVFRSWDFLRKEVVVNTPTWGVCSCSLSSECGLYTDFFRAQLVSTLVSPCLQSTGSPSSFKLTLKGASVAFTDQGNGNALQAVSRSCPCGLTLGH